MGGRQLAALDLAGAVGIETQRPLRAHPRIELAQRAGGAVARVGQHLAAVQPRLFVVFLEIGARHVDLASHLQHCRPARAFEPGRDHLDLAQVGGDVLAAAAVAAGRALHEHTVLVTQADRQAIKLGLGREQQRAALQALVDAAHEVTHFLVAEGIAQRQHRHRVHHLGKARGWPAADLVGRGIGAVQLRMGRLQRFQFSQQPVVIGIGNQLLVMLVVGLRGRGQLLAEFGDAAAGGGFGSHARILPAHGCMQRVWPAAQTARGAACDAPLPWSARRAHQRGGLVSGGAWCWRS